MTRLVPLTVLVLELAASRLASAQATMTTLSPGGGTITFDKLQVRDGDTGEFFEPNTDKRPLYFNLAHCTCAKAGHDTFQYWVTETVVTNTSYNLHFFVGASCASATPTDRKTNCREPTTPTSLPVDELKNGEYLNFNLYDVVNGQLHVGEDCQQLEGASVWALYSSTGSPDTLDTYFPQEVGKLSTDTSSSITGVDTLPPPTPKDVSASPSENAIDIHWTAPSTNNTSISYFQALCAKDGSTTPVRSGTAHYVTAKSLCGADDPASVKIIEQPLDNGEHAVTLAESPLANLDHNYICGEVASASATSMTIDGLENGTAYQVMLMAVDLHGNYNATFLDHTITPHAVTDFWEDLQGRGSKVNGGLCLLAETYGDDSGLTQGLRAFRDDSLAGSRAGRWLIRGYYATFGKLGRLVHGSLVLRFVAGTLLLPAVALALACHALTLPGLLAALVATGWLFWRRRQLAGWLVRRSHAGGLLRGGVIALVAGLTLYAPRAHAGSGFQPYWETNDPIEDQNQELPDDPGLVRWHVGIKVGPYVPDIDKQFGGKPGPYEQMFGNFRLLPMLDVERIIWSGYGQIGVGGTIGYLQRSARAFAMGSNPTDLDRPRDANARNAFHLIPMALTATYRFTVLDDEYGIPLVPYVRGGLSYYVWWMTAPNDNFSVVCKDGTDTDADPSCSRDKALGASLGVQGSIGLAIRAERIDASAARSMRASGIQHAGIYGELSASKVDGFGSASKLSVGARTWFAGVDFEF